MASQDEAKGAPQSLPGTEETSATDALPGEETDPFEPATPFGRLALYWIGIAISLIHLYFNLVSPPSTLVQNAVHFGGFALLCVLIFPLFRPASGQPSRLSQAFDLSIGLLAAFSALYMVMREDAIYAQGVRLGPGEWLFGALLILCAIELTRRTTGLIIPVLIILALSYVAFWGDLISGVFQFGGLSVETILFRSVYGDDGIFGTIARISSTFVFMFILFGAFLLRSGGGDFVIDLARVLAGRLVGGPGLVSVIASGLTGMISGSAVANTASTGVITIPLMKRAGFPRAFAGGVEAAASTGGQLMPPIMGAGAFVMASYTQIPYGTIVLVSFLPAVLYFLTVAAFVRIEAKKTGLQPLDQSDLKLGQVLARGGLPFLLPIVLLVILLMNGYTPVYAAGISIGAVIVASWFTPNRMGPRAILDALALGAKNMVTTAVLLCSVGLVVNVIAMAGLGNTFSLMITNWADDNLFIAITLVALASLILGMGLPVTAAYIVLGTLSAPALYQLIASGLLADVIASGAMSETARSFLMLADPGAADLLGAAMPLEDAKALLASLPPEIIGLLRDELVDEQALVYALLAAHLIVFWLSQDSNVTPPVCLAAFTAAAIAKAPPMRTGLNSWRIAKGLYIMPLLFAYTPLIGGTPLEVAKVGLFALFGLYAFAGVFQGYMERPLTIALRAALVAATVLLLWPTTWLLHVVGLALFAVVFALHLRGEPAPAPQGSLARD